MFGRIHQWNHVALGCCCCCSCWGFFFFSSLLIHSFHPLLSVQIFCFFMTQFWFVDSHKGFLTDRCCPSPCSSGASRPQPRGAGTSTLSPAGSTAGTEVHLPMTWCTGRWDSSQVPSHMVLDPTIPTETLLFVEGCWIFVVEGRKKIRDVLRHHDAQLGFVLLSQFVMVLDSHFQQSSNDTLRSLVWNQTSECHTGNWSHPSFVLTEREGFRSDPEEDKTVGVKGRTRASHFSLYQGHAHHVSVLTMSFVFCIWYFDIWGPCWLQGDSPPRVSSS